MKEKTDISFTVGKSDRNEKSLPNRKRFFVIFLLPPRMSAVRNGYEGERPFVLSPAGFSNFPVRGFAPHGRKIRWLLLHQHTETAASMQPFHCVSVFLSEGAETVSFFKRKGFPPFISHTHSAASMQPLYCVKGFLLEGLETFCFRRKKRFPKINQNALTILSTAFSVFSGVLKAVRRK